MKNTKKIDRIDISPRLYPQKAIPILVSKLNEIINVFNFLSTSTDEDLLPEAAKSIKSTYDTIQVTANGGLTSSEWKRVKIMQIDRIRDAVSEEKVRIREKVEKIGTFILPEDTGYNGKLIDKRDVLNLFT